MSRRLRVFIRLFGFVFPLISMWILAYIFVSAFLCGGSVTVDVNNFGEMWPELVLLVVSLPVSTVYLWIALRSTWHEYKKHPKGER